LIMPYTFSIAVRANITNLLADANAGLISYGNIYDYMANVGDGQVGVDPASIAWLRGAAGVNRNDGGAASNFIRKYTEAQLNIRSGNTVSASNLQAASDKIAKNVIEDALNINSIPSLASIAANDANVAAADFFNGDKAGWSGNLLFLVLGYTQAFDQNILPDTYNLLAAAKSAKIALGVTDFWGGLGVLTSNFNYQGAIDIGVSAILTDQKLEALYGDGVFSLGFTPATRIILGKSGAKNDTLNTLTPDDDYVHAEGGDDTIIASAGADIIDGGDGIDTLDYSGISTAQYLQLFDVRVTADLPSGAPVIVNIEHVVGTSGNDTIIGSEKDNTIEGGGGDDILKGGGAESSLHGGTGKDIFSLSNMSFIMDGETSDRSFWGGYLISGGVQQWWQEGGYAYYSAAAPLVNVGIGSQILLGALTLFDAPFMTPTRFAMTTSNQLIIQKGRHHTAFVQDYDYEDATAGITVFRQALTTDGTIADLTRYMKLALKASGMISPDADPLIIDMNGDGITLSRVGSATSVYIDANNDGFAENRGWVRGGDALLVRDTNGNGRVDGWGELFGNASESGFAALRAFDSNADDRITAADAHFSRLHVWVDDNHNAISEAGELRTLSHAGITALSLATRAPAPSCTAISHLQAA
jgi:hypothetical protein